MVQLKRPELNAPEHRCVLFNALLGVTLAALLDFHVAPSALIDVPDGMLIEDARTY
jgi:hypothetical protein